MANVPPARPRSATDRPIGKWKMKRRARGAGVGGVPPGRRVKKPDQSAYGLAKNRRRRIVRRFGIGAAILGAVGLAWLLWPSSQPRVPTIPPHNVPRVEAPERPRTHLPTPVDKKIQSPTAPVQGGETTKPKGKSAEELEAERGEKKFNTGIETVTTARNKIEKISKNLGITFDRTPLWKYNRENPAGWREKIAVNQLVLIGDFYGGQPYFGIVKSTHPLVFINQEGYPVNEGVFIPPDFYVQTIYGGTLNK